VQDRLPAVATVLSKRIPTRVPEVTVVESMTEAGTVTVNAFDALFIMKQTK
jgi:hypothetical protein